LVIFAKNERGGHDLVHSFKGTVFRKKSPAPYLVIFSHDFNMKITKRRGFAFVGVPRFSGIKRLARIKRKATFEILFDYRKFPESTRGRLRRCYAFSNTRLVPISICGIYSTDTAYQTSSQSG
jgi:hypothetical protein